MDVTNANDRRYPAETLKQALAKIPAEMLGTLGYREGHPVLADAAFRATGFAMNERGDLIGEIEILDTADGRKVTEMLQAGQAVFRTSGVGNLDGNRVVDFEINTLAAISRAEDAFGSTGTL